MQKAAKDRDALPIFQTHNEPSSIQLFYDLFFVANLSACTTNHGIVDSRSLEAYVGFFTLLWFTWFGTIIFDVRFAIEQGLFVRRYDGLRYELGLLRDQRRRTFWT